VVPHVVGHRHRERGMTLIHVRGARVVEHRRRGQRVGATRLELAGPLTAELDRLRHDLGAHARLRRRSGVIGVLGTTGTETHIGLVRGGRRVQGDAVTRIHQAIDIGRRDRHGPVLVVRWPQDRRSAHRDRVVVAVQIIGLHPSAAAPIVGAVVSDGLDRVALSVASVRVRSASGGPNQSEDAQRSKRRGGHQSKNASAHLTPYSGSVP